MFHYSYKIFQTTTTVTSTLSTTTACYTTGTIASSCSKKKRSISDEPIKGMNQQDLRINILALFKLTIPTQKKMFYYHSTGLEDASQIMPSSGLGISKEMLFPEMDKTENKSNKKSSPRSSKVMDLNKVGIAPLKIIF